MFISIPSKFYLKDKRTSRKAFMKVAANKKKLRSR